MSPFQSRGQAAPSLCLKHRCHILTIYNARENQALSWASILLLSHILTPWCTEGGSCGEAQVSLYFPSSVLLFSLLQGRDYRVVSLYQSLKNTLSSQVSLLGPGQDKIPHLYLLQLCTADSVWFWAESLQTGQSLGPRLHLQPPLSLSQIISRAHSPSRTIQKQAELRHTLLSASAWYLGGPTSLQPSQVVTEKQRFSRFPLKIDRFQGLYSQACFMTGTLRICSALGFTHPN